MMLLNRKGIGALALVERDAYKVVLSSLCSKNQAVIGPRSAVVLFLNTTRSFPSPRAVKRYQSASSASRMLAALALRGPTQTKSQSNGDAQSRYHGVLAPARPARTTDGADWSHRPGVARS